MAPTLRSAHQPPPPPPPQPPRRPDNMDPIQRYDAGRNLCQNPICQRYRRRTADMKRRGHITIANRRPNCLCGTSRRTASRKAIGGLGQRGQKPRNVSQEITPAVVREAILLRAEAILGLPLRPPRVNVLPFQPRPFRINLQRLRAAPTSSLSPPAPTSSLSPPAPTPFSPVHAAPPSSSSISFRLSPSPSSTSSMISFQLSPSPSSSSPPASPVHIRRRLYPEPLPPSSSSSSSSPSPPQPPSPVPSPSTSPSPPTSPLRDMSLSPPPPSPAPPSSSSSSSSSASCSPPSSSLQPTYGRLSSESGVAVYSSDEGTSGR